MAWHVGQVIERVGHKQRERTTADMRKLDENRPPLSNGHIESALEEELRNHGWNLLLKSN